MIFWNVELNEKIYMEQPDVFAVDGQKGKVCKFLKSLYMVLRKPLSFGMQILKEL